jgi:serine/threonine-protein kinase
MFVRRHWLPLGAAATLLVVLLASGAAIVWQARQIAREATTTVAVKDFLFGLFTAVDPRTAKGRDVSARELLDRGAERIGRNRALDVAQHAELEATLGRIYYQLGLFDQADKLQQAALDTLARDAGAPALFARTEIDRIDTLVDRSDLKTAQTLIDDVRARLRDAAGSASVEAARADLAEARIAIDQRDWAKTARFADAALVRLRAMPDADPALLRRALLSAGAANWGLGKAAEAEQAFREVLAAAAADGEADSIDSAKAYTNLGLSLQIQSRYREASEAADKALGLYAKLLGADHALTLSAQRDLALAHYRLGLYPQARREFEANLAAVRAKFGAGHLLIAGTEINLGNLLVDSGDAAAADPVLSEALAIFEKKYGRDHDGARQSLGNLAVAHAGEGRLDQAESELRELLERERNDTKQVVVDNVNAYRLGDVLRLEGRWQEALGLQREALASLQKLHGENHRWTAAAHRALALSLRDSGDDAGAERELRAALTGFPGAEPPFTATVKYELGGLLLRRPAARSEAIEMLAAAAGLREQYLGADSPLTAEAREALRAAQGPAKA